MSLFGRITPTGSPSVPTQFPVINPSYADFLAIGDHDYDGDINFDFQIDWPATLGADPAFWDTSPQFGQAWYHDPDCCGGGFLLNYLSGTGFVIHAEVIMYGLYDSTACQCGPRYPVLGGHPAFLPAWGQRGDESVRLSTEPGGPSGPVNGDGRLFANRIAATSYVRITGTLITDCHGSISVDCEGSDDHVEVHQVNSIDVVPPGVAAKYSELGGGSGFLGFPVDRPLSTPFGAVDAQRLTGDGAGLIEDFRSGSIVWSAQTGAHDLFGPILERWIQIGSVLSPLAYPTADEQATSDGAHLCDFQGGTISLSPTNGVLVTDRGLSVNPPGTQEVVEGLAHPFDLGAFAALVGGPWSLVVNWGDGGPHTSVIAETPGPLSAQIHIFEEEAVDTVTVRVTDIADGAFASTTFLVNVIVTPASLIAEVEHLIETGQLREHEGKSLLKRLERAAAAVTRGKCEEARERYRSFIEDLKESKQLAKAVAKSLIRDAQYLIAKCPVEEDDLKVAGGVGSTDEPSALTFSLGWAVPSPFSSSTTIAYDLPHPSAVGLRVYDVLGRLVRVLVESDPQPAGRHTVSWDGKSANGISVTGGVYFYRLEAGAYRETHRLLFLR